MTAMGGTNTSSAHLYDSGAIWACQWVAAAKAAIALIGAPEVFAGVSASDLDVAYIGGQRECHQRHDGAIKDCCRYAAVAAILARLRVSLVAPVDPEAVTAEYHDRRADLAPREFWPWRCVGDGNGRGESIAAMRATLTAAGIPVTPERK